LDGAHLPVHSGEQPLERAGEAQLPWRERVDAAQDEGAMAVP
jgi:hypothetical protein